MKNCECDKNGEQSAASTKLKKCCFSIVLFVVLCVIVLVIMEAVAMKLYPRLPESGRAAAESLMGKDDSSRTGSYLQHPYMYYVYRPGYKNWFL